MIASMALRRALIALGLAGAALGGGFAWSRFRQDLAAARRRVASGSMLVHTRHGLMEFAEEGAGPPVLMIHGTGGGFDQGLRFGRRLTAGFRTLAPSRFGYLRSAMPADASPEAQADAFVDLLDALGIDRVPIIGGSAGAMSAIAFAIRHPDRCAGLIALVPATHAPGRSLALPPGALTEFIITEGLRSDFLYWLGFKTAERAMTGALLATDPALVDAASPADQARAHAILRDILPISARADGLLNDARLSGAPPPMALRDIRVPTLAIATEDDRFHTYAAAKYIADEVPGARLVSWPTGGHLWVGHEAEVVAEVQRFLRAL